MTEERKGQIALLTLKAKLRDEGIRLKPDMRREIGNSSKRINISIEEGTEFFETLVREMVEEVFAPSSVAYHNPDHDREPGSKAPNLPDTRDML